MFYLFFFSSFLIIYNLVVFILFIFLKLKIHVLRDSILNSLSGVIESRQNKKNYEIASPEKE